ncbi:MAG: phosphonate C-P lyase system protein PhnH [Desulfotomaculum sp.]|nr:phosphonate C-P lyase system protein PhnH [Desulfotomaculum sp.]
MTGSCNLKNEIIASEITGTQITFRALLDCMARPGKIASLKMFNGHFEFCFNRYTLGVAITLLDQEVTFHLPDHQGDSAQQLQMYTLARPAELVDCDYLLVNGKENFAVQQLKTGHLKYPDESATIICQVAQLAADQSGLEQSAPTDIVKLQLQGPGILKMCQVYISGLNRQLLAPWQQCNQEFPLGLDWIFIDQAGQVCCIPRSTKFTWV